MLDAILFLGGLGIVPAIHGAHQITGDAADALKTDVAIVLGTAAAGALVINDAGVAADGIAVNGMVDTAVADAGLLHAADYLFKSVQILQRIAVHLDVADVTGVGQSMVGGFLLDLLKGADGIVDGNMEAVGVVRKR